MTVGLFLTPPSSMPPSYPILQCFRQASISQAKPRSNVETTFSMIKRKVGERLRSKTYPAQVNEVLAKVLCHNVCCLIQSMYEFGVEIDFSEGLSE
jgi:hypothetical protein